MAADTLASVGSRFGHAEQGAHEQEFTRGVGFDSSPNAMAMAFEVMLS